MPSDAELARAEVSPAAIRVALAVRVLRAEGGRVTIERIMDATGHGKTQVYEARAELRRRWPDEFPDSKAEDRLERQSIMEWVAATRAAAKCADCGWGRDPRALVFHHRDPSTRSLHISDGSHGTRDELEREMAKCDVLCLSCHQVRHASGNLDGTIRPSGYPSGEPESPGTVPDTRKPAGQMVPAPRLDKAALLLPGTDVQPAPSTGLAPWRTALAEVVVPMEGQRSWDAYTVYSQAWDLIPDLIPPDDDPTADAALVVGNQIALAADFVRRMVDGLELEVDTRLIAMLVRQFGKAALWGLNKALGVTDELTTRDLYRYARATAANVVADLGAQP